MVWKKKVKFGFCDGNREYIAPYNITGKIIETTYKFKIVAEYSNNFEIDDVEVIKPTNYYDYFSKVNLPKLISKKNVYDIHEKELNWFQRNF